MINPQFKTDSLKIGSSVPSISLNYGRHSAKRPSAGSGKGNSCRLFVKRRNEIHALSDRDTVHIVEIKIEKRKITKDNTISNL